MARPAALFPGALLLCALLLSGCVTDSTGRPVQIPISRVQRMPDAPSRYQMRDWREVAREYDRLLFDPNTRDPAGRPLLSWDHNRMNFAVDTFFLPSYVGDDRQRPGSQEAINTMAAVLGATLVGIDKGGRPPGDAEPGVANLVLAQTQYYNTVAGLLLNNVGRGPYTGHTFWYELYPAIFFSCLVDRYPNLADEPVPLSAGGTMSMRGIMYQTASRYQEASRIMGHGPDAPGYAFTSFDFTTMTPVWNGRWREPDAAAGIAWLQYAAYRAFGQERFLDGADWALGYLDSIDFNPLYESLLPWGALVAARMNAELGRSYDVRRLVEWCFGPSDSRPGWGIIADTFGEYEAHGLMGSLTDGGGYAFAMNTFDAAAALVPIVRYDPRYAHAIGKWMLNLANNARLFYPDFLPQRNQSTPRWDADPHSVVAYEGLRKSWEGVSPYATGDSLRFGWGSTDLGLYGSSHVGLLGAMVRTTNVSQVLQLDLLATDHFRPPAYPTYLYYNPHAGVRSVRVDIGPGETDLYSATDKRFVATRVSGSYMLELPARSASVVVLTPGGAVASIENGKLVVDGIVVDYQPLAVVVSSPADGAVVYGRQPVAVAHEAYGTVSVESVSVLMDGVPVNSGSLPDGLEIDSRGLPDGSVHELTVTVTGADGTRAFDTVRFVADNRPLSQNGARDFRNWSGAGRHPGRVVIQGSVTRLEAGRQGAPRAEIMSPAIRLDADRGPVLVFDGFYTEAAWSVSVESADGTSRDAAVRRDEDGYVEVDLASALAGLPRGAADARVRIVLAAAGGAISFFHENVEIVYTR